MLAQRFFPQMKAHLFRSPGHSMLMINLIGGVLGPMAVALFTDVIFHDPAKLHLASAATGAVASSLALDCLPVGAWGVRRFSSLEAVP